MIEDVLLSYSSFAKNGMNLQEALSRANDCLSDRKWKILF